MAFKTRSPCQSLGDYDYRDYYNIVTNNADGDSTIDIGDTAGCWHSGLMPDDAYWIKVTVSDVAGNSTTDSMLVHTANGNGIAEAGKPTSWHNLDVPTFARVGREMARSYLSLRATRAASCDSTVRWAGRNSHSTATWRAGRHTLSFSPTTAGVHLVVLTLAGNRIVGKLTVVR